MSAESKPSKWATSAAAELFADRHGGVPLKVVGSAARVIDREAVAPAVRELVEALSLLNEYAFSQAAAGKIGIANIMNEADKMLNDYRHLLDQPEEKPLTNWRKTVNIKDFIRKGDMSPEGARLVAGQIAGLLRSKLASEIEGSEDFTLDLIVEELENIGNSNDATIDDLDNMLSELYDWADSNRVWLGI